MARKHTTAFFSDSVKRTNKSFMGEEMDSSFKVISSKSGTPRVRGVTSRVREVLRGPQPYKQLPHRRPAYGVSMNARGEAKGFAPISPRKIGVTDEEPRRKLVLDKDNQKFESHPLTEQFQSLRRISRVRVVECQVSQNSSEQ